MVCGRSVSRRTDLVSRIRRILGESCAGVFDEMEKESPLPAILRARDAARAANADLLIAVGAGWSFRPREFVPARSQKWRLGIQRELAKDMVPPIPAPAE